MGTNKEISIHDLGKDKHKLDVRKCTQCLKVILLNKVSKRIEYSMRFMKILCLIYTG